MQDRGVLSFSLESWGHVWRNRHQIMSRLARRRRVLFVSPPRYVREVFAPYGAERAEQPGVTHVADGLYTCVPSRWLPSNYRFPRLESAAEALRRRRIHAAMHRLGIERPVLYLWHPQFVEQIGRHDESLVVYHCYDEFLSFTGSAAERERLVAQERQLLARADIVFASSQQLADRRRPLNANTHTIENGVDYAAFAAARLASTAVPPAIAALPRPVIGAVVTLLDMVDLKMLAALARRHAQGSLVLVGVDRPPPGDAARDALAALPNVHFLGRQPIERIPAHLKGFDVCLIPYVVNGVTEVASSPLKLYEYLAAGKPVVCYRLPLKPELAGVARVADGSDEWIAQVDAALAEGETDAHVAARQQVARDNTWDQRVAQIEALLSRELAQRG